MAVLLSPWNIKSDALMQTLVWFLTAGSKFVANGCRLAENTTPEINASSCLFHQMLLEDKSWLKFVCSKEL